MRKILSYILILQVLLFCTTVSSSEISKRCLQLFNNADYQNALNICKTAARQGDTASQTALGEMYDAGNGVQSNQKLVAKWWTEAAAKAYLPAQNLLALKYYYGGDIFEQQDEWKQDYSKAFQIWKDSAYQGEATSQFMLGEMYLHGQGVEKNYIESFAWFKIALAGGYKLATDSLIELSRLMTIEQKQSAKLRLQMLQKKIKK